MTYTELTDEVTIAVKEAPAKIVSAIPDYINDAILIIAGEVNVPSLKSVLAVTTVLSQAWVQLPAGYDGQLRYVGTSDGKVTLIDGGVEALLELYPELDEVGDVEYACLEHTTLYYQGIPEEETTLTLVVYKNPTLLSNGTDSPDFLPTPLHRGLIVHKAAEIAYDKIEDGISAEEKKANTIWHRSMYDDAKASLEAWVAKRKSHVGTSVWWDL